MKYTIEQFNKIYPDDDACLDKIFKDKYSNQDICSTCNKKTNFYKRTGMKCYSCQWCGDCIYPLVGTIFEKSSTSLKNWFYVIFLFSNSKNGVAAKEIERQLGVTYKCAWRICNRIRKLFAENDNNDIIATDGGSNHVYEMYETYVGGKEKNKHMSKKTMNSQGRSLKKKIPIIGIVQKGGKIVAKVSQSTNNIAINKLLKQYVPVDSEIHTDEYKGYNQVKKIGYKHKRVNHGKGKFVVQDAHTNTIEGFWSQLKRSVHGTYHAVSPKYLQNYVDEFAFRFNLRKSEKPIFD
jgi:transposase